MKIVEFSNGQYGIRKGFIFKKYCDLCTHNFWWAKSNKNFKDCLGTKEEVKKRYENLIVKDRILTEEQFYSLFEKQD